MKNKHRIIILFCVLMATVTPFTVYAQTKNAPKMLPDIEIKLQDGDSLKLKDLKGKVVLLDFWYRGCYPCLKAVPHLIELQEEFKNDLVIIGVNDFDIQEDAADYFTYKKANYRSTFKTKVLLYKLFNVEGFPTTLLYDKEGNLIKADTGFSEGMMRSLRRAVKKAVQ